MEILIFIGGGILRKNAVIPAKAGIYSGRLILEFRGFYGKFSLEFSRIFFVKKRGECGGLSVKMDSRVRGNDGGEAGICRRESDSGGGDSDLHRNGNAAEFCEKTLSFPRNWNLFGAINFGISAKRPGKVHSIFRVHDSPPTFVGGETSSAEFTPPRISIVCGKCRGLQQ